MFIRHLSLFQPSRLALVMVTMGATLAAALVLPSAARAETLTLRSDYWCPYNCTPGGEPPGYMIEIARKVFEPAGYTIDYQLMPYDEAIEAARKGEITAVVGAARKDAPDLAFTASSQGTTTYAFASAKGSGFVYKGVESLKGIRLGAIQDYTYDAAIDAHIAAGEGVTLVSGDTATRDLVQLLADRKVDVIIEGDAVLDYTIAEMGMTNLFDLFVASEGAPVYIAFSPAHPKVAELVTLLDKGVADLRTSGELAKIMRRYGKKDWQ